MSGKVRQAAKLDNEIHYNVGELGLDDLEEKESRDKEE